MRCLTCSYDAPVDATYCPGCGAPLGDEGDEATVISSGGTEHLVRTKTQTAEAPATRVGDLVAGKYRIKKLLGEGAFGEVYLAEQEGSGEGRKVALKFLHAEHGANRKVFKRFFGEAQVLLQLDNPHVVRLWEYVWVGGTLVMVLEFVEGRSLEDLLGPRSRIESRRRLELPEAVSIGRQVCEALQVAHNRNVFHRDVKPANIMVRPGVLEPYHAKLLDFGVARIQGDRPREDETGQHIVGTALYMAPEQAACQNDIDGRADLYALGIILFEALSGLHPLADPATGATQTGLPLFMAQMSQPPLRLERVTEPGELPTSAAELVAELLAKNRDDRPSTAREVAARLDAVLRDYEEMHQAEGPRPPKPDEHTTERTQDDSRVDVRPVEPPAPSGEQSASDETGRVPEEPPREPPQDSVQDRREDEEPVATRSRRRTWPLALLGLGALLLAAVAFGFWGRGGESGPAPVAAPELGPADVGIAPDLRPPDGGVRKPPTVPGPGPEKDDGTQAADPPDAAPAPESVKLKSKPSGAAVYGRMPDGKIHRLGKTPLTVEVPAEGRRIQLRRKGCKRHSLSLRQGVGPVVEAKLDCPPPPLPKLSLTAELDGKPIAGAEVRLKGKRLGVTPLRVPVDEQATRRFQMSYTRGEVDYWCEVTVRAGARRAGVCRLMRD